MNLDSFKREQRAKPKECVQCVPPVQLLCLPSHIFIANVDGSLQYSMFDKNGDVIPMERS